MKAFHKIFMVIIGVLAILFAAANMILLADSSGSGRPYRVEINRLARQMETDGYADISGCKYVTGIEKYEKNDYATALRTCCAERTRATLLAACVHLRMYARVLVPSFSGDTCVRKDMGHKYGEDFFSTDSDYAVREINGVLYRFDYRADCTSAGMRLIVTVNVILGVMAVFVISVMLYIKFHILAPFERLADVPYELSKGNLTVPVRATKNRFFGRFIWGVDMLRENMEQQKKRELELQKDKKMLLLSLSHDIKTPLSAIKLYAKALSKGLYESREKQLEIADSISAKADEIEGYVSQIVTASREDFLSFDVNMGEFYLSELVAKIKGYYTEKLSLIGTDFSVSGYSDCLLNGDFDRSVEVLQNIMENAVKYGDGKSIVLHLSEEDNCILITVRNSGGTLACTDLPNVFDSFWRGTNAGNIAGSGLGLYISRKLMRKMDGEIFAEITDGIMRVTAVFTKV